MVDIKKYEAMVKINLTDDERRRVTGNAETLIKSFGALEDIDTTHVEMLVAVLDIRNVLRDDISVKMISRDELLESAPDRNGDYYQAPKTIE